MSVLQVLHIPDERLRKVAKPVEEVNAEIQRIVDDMFETMYAEEGIGLAAKQATSSWFSLTQSCWKRRRNRH